MTVNTDSSVVTYQGNGSTTTFSFPYSVPDKNTIVVFITDSTGAVTQLSQSVYTVSLNPLVGTNPTVAGGSVTLLGPPVPVGSSISIARILPVVQPVSLTNQSIMYPPVIERELDYLTMLDQQADEGSSRAFVVPIGDPIPIPVPSVAMRANLAAFFDSFGNLTAGGIPSGGVFISAAMIPVVGAATTALALQLLGGAPASAAATTGDLKPTHKVVADPGWIMWIDGTIGDATSGAGIRANVDTQALFTLYYNSYADGNCPLLTSTGLATTRAAQGAAATAFAAHCRMTLPKGAGRDLAIAGSGAGLTFRTIGSFNGAETHTPSELTMYQHTHVIHDLNAFVTTTTDGTLLGLAAGGDYSFYHVNGYQYASSFPDFIGFSQAFSTLDPRTYVNVMVKL